MVTPEAARWLQEAVITGDLDRIQASMGAAGDRINDARSDVKAARTISVDSPTLAIAGCHDAARKAITAHMVANGYRPRKGDGAHKIVLQYGRVLLAQVVAEEDLDALDDLKRDRADAEYGDFAEAVRRRAPRRGGRPRRADRPSRRSGACRPEAGLIEARRRSGYPARSSWSARAFALTLARNSGST